jgi:eukaryotic-like serine/threonine-protein kinase
MTELPDKVGHFTVAARLGSGGMGEVLLAYSPGGEPVAVKLIRSDRLNEQTRARFEQEALKARTVVRTSRVALFLDADPYAERPWLAMQYVSGATLGSFVDRAGVLPPLLVASVGTLLAEGLSAVHTVGLLHRDLKPANVILADDGPVIIDFGLAAFVDAASSLSHAGMVIGTPVAMPPEQAAGQTRVTGAADVYGLGVVLLYAAAGHYPYTGATPDVIITRVASAEVSPNLDGLPPVLEPLVRAMLAHDPADRPTVEQVAHQCAALIVNGGMTTIRARRSLLKYAAEHADPRPPEVDAYSVSSSLEARIDAEAAALVDQAAPGIEVLDSPLDGSPGLFDGLLRELAEPEVAEVITLAAVNPSGESPVAAEPEHTPKRLPAAFRIAEELRGAYAHSGAL